MTTSKLKAKMIFIDPLDEVAFSIPYDWFENTQDDDNENYNDNEEPDMSLTAEEENLENDVYDE